MLLKYVCGCHSIRLIVIKRITVLVLSNLRGEHLRERQPAFAILPRTSRGQRLTSLRYIVIEVIDHGKPSAVHR